jgi:hypothetical protein
MAKITADRLVKHLEQTGYVYADEEALSSSE